MRARSWPSGFKRMILGILFLFLATLLTSVLISATIYTAYVLHIVTIVVPVVFFVTVFFVLFVRAKLSSIEIRLAAMESKFYIVHCANCTGRTCRLCQGRGYVLQSYPSEDYGLTDTENSDILK